MNAKETQTEALCCLIKRALLFCITFHLLSSADSIVKYSHNSLDLHLYLLVHCAQ